MEHRRSKLVLFFVAQALAVGTMIFVLPAGLHPHCDRDGCAQAGAASAIVTMVVIVGELWVLSRALRDDGAVWRSILALGILSLIAAPFALLFARAFGVPGASVQVVIIWHLAAGLLLLVTGATGGACQLLARLRRSDERGSEGGGSSAMWPLD